MVLLPDPATTGRGWLVFCRRVPSPRASADEGGYSRSFGVEGHRGLIHLAPDEEAQGLR